MSLKKLRLPHTLILIYAMVVLTVVTTWVIPGGEYQRVEKDGRMVPVAGSYARVASRPQGLGGLLVSPIRGFMDAGGYDDERWWETEADRRWRRGGCLIFFQGCHVVDNFSDGIGLPACASAG